MINFKKIFKKDITLYLILTIFCFYSFFGSIIQGRYIYDGYHWGLVASAANEFLYGKVLYKEVFVHYGILTTLLHSLALKIYNSIFSLIFLSSLFYVSGTVFLTFIVKKFTNSYYCYLLLYLFFFLQPFTVYPWHTYFAYFFLVFGLFLYLYKNTYSYFLFGICIQLVYLSSNSFKIYVYLIFSLTLILIYFENKYEIKILIRQSLAFIIGFFLPFLLFIVYLKNLGAYEHWLQSDISQIFLKIENKSIFIFIYQLFLTYIASLKSILSKPYIIFGLMINLSCLYFILNSFSKKKILNYNLLFISIFSILLNHMLVLHFNTFRVFNGLIIGVVVLFYILSLTKNIKIKEFIILFLILLAPFANPFSKSEANLIFSYLSTKEQSYKNADYIYFKKMKYEKDVWNHLEKLNNIAFNIKKNCKKIENYYNLTSDHFYFLILSKYFKTDQKIPGYHEDYLQNYYNHFIQAIDKELVKNFRNKVLSNKTIFIREKFVKKNLNLNETNINLKEYTFIDLPYSFNNKKKQIYIPRSCLILMSK